MSAVSLLTELIQIVGTTGKRRFIFGYGSLINTKSRNASYETPIAHPVRLNDYKRIWNRAEGTNQPWMGIIPMPSSTVNGVLFEVDNEMINAFDKRELKWGYHRKQIPISKIDVLSKQNGIKLDEKNDLIETYELNILNEQQMTKMDVHSSEYKQLRVNPQCYIDVVLKGCLEYGEPFCIEFIQTMHDWRFKWRLDRSDKMRARRAWDLTQKECEYFDQMLKKYIMEFHGFVPFHLQLK